MTSRRTGRPDGSLAGDAPRAPARLVPRRAGPFRALSPRRDPGRPRPQSGGGDAKRGLLWALVATVLFAVMNVLARLASGRAPWLEVAASRSIVGAFVAIAVARTRGVSLQIHDQKKAWGRTLCGTCAMLCTFYTLGAPQIAVGDVVTLRATGPVFIALMAPWVIGEAGSWRIWASIALAFTGVVVLIQPNFEIAGPIALFATLGAFFSACAMMFLRRLSPKESPEAVAAHFSIFASVVMTALSIPAFSMPDGFGFFLLASTGITAGLGQIAMTRAYALDRAARVGTVHYLDIVITQLLAAWWIGDRPSGSQIIGSSLVIAGGVMLAIGAFREVGPEPRESPA